MHSLRPIGAHLLLTGQLATSMGATAALEQNQRAAVLAIGTANPANSVLQDEFPDWYFRVTRNEHLCITDTRYGYGDT